MTKLRFYGALFLAIGFLTACQSVLGQNNNNAVATQVALQATVVTMQETVVALESNAQEAAEQAAAIQDATTSEEDEAIIPPTPEPEIVVVTATPVDTPTDVPTATSLPTEPAPTSTPTVPPTATDEPVAEVEANQSTQQDTIIVVVTATPVPSPTPKSYEDAPVLISPVEGAVVEEKREMLLQWSWNGLLAENEHFDVKIRPDGQDRSAYVAWEVGEGHNFVANLTPGRYYWSVQVIQGYYQNDSGHPEDRVFEAFLSPESEERLIIVGERPPDNPRSVSQADPAAPELPVSLALTGLAFAAFVGFIQRRKLM